MRLGPPEVFLEPTAQKVWYSTRIVFLHGIESKAKILTLVLVVHKQLACAPAETRQLCVLFTMLFMEVTPIGR